MLAPTRLIAGSRTRKPALAVVEILAESLLDAEIKIIKNAGHMSPFTHVGQVNMLVSEHIEACQNRDE